MSLKYGEPDIPFEDELKLEPSEKASRKLPWWVWLVVILFPIRLFHPWWLGAICFAALCGVLACLMQLRAR